MISIINKVYFRIHTQRKQQEFSDIFSSFHFRKNIHEAV